MRKFSIGEAVKFGWRSTLANIWFFAALILVFWVLLFVSDKVSGAFERSPLLFLASNILFYAINVILTMGALKIILGICDGRRLDPTDIYKCYPLTLRYIGASLLFGLAVGLGLLMLVVPGIIIALRLQFFSYYIVDKNQGAVESLKSSFRDTDGSTLGLLGLWVVFLGIALAGLIALIVGLIVAIPVIMMAAAFVYRKLSGAAPSAAPGVAPAATAAAAAPSPFMSSQPAAGQSGTPSVPVNKNILIALGVVIVFLAGILFATMISSQKRGADNVKAKVETEMAVIKKKLAELEGLEPAPKFVPAPAPVSSPAQVQSPAQSPITQDDINKINELEKVWATNLDSIGKAIARADFTAVDQHIDTSLRAIQAMRQLMINKGHDPKKVEYLDAMEMMTLAYANLEEIAIVSKIPTGQQKDFSEIAQLYAETAESLDRAAAIFDRTGAPALAVICRNIKQETTKIMVDLERKTGKKLI